MADRDRSTSGNTIALWILAVLAAMFFLRTARTLLIPIALAVLISYALEPVVAWLERYRLPRWAGAALVLLAILGTGAIGAYVLRDDAQQIVDMLPKAVERARDMMASQLGSRADAIQTAAGSGQPGQPSSGGVE